MKRFISLSLALVMMLAMFAGCSEKEATATKAPDATATEAAGTPSTEGKNIRTDLVICNTADVVTLDPPESTDTYSNTVINMVFDTLIDLDADSNYKPGLAESWDISDDSKTITFHIREGVKFHNGETLTPTDVKFSLDRAKYEIAQSKAMLESVEEILCDDEAMTVTLKMIEPSAAILVNLTEGAMHIQNKKFVEEHPDDINQHACGTGPMMLEEWHINDYVMLKRFDEHWAGTPVTTSIKIRVIPEPTSRTIALEAGEIDWLAGVNSIDIARVMENEKLKTMEVPGSSIVYIAPNQNREPWNNKLVRQALHYATDKATMIEVVYEGYALPGESPFPNIMPFWKSNPVEFDLEKAKALLAEAGYPDGLGRTIELGVSSDERNRMAQILQSDCAKIGIDIKIELMEFGALMEHCDGNHDLIMLGWGHATNQDRTMRMNFHSSTIGANGNRAWCNNPDIDRLIDAGAVEMNQEKREAIYHELQDLIADETPWIPIMQQITVYGMNKNLEGIEWYKRGGGYYCNGYVIED